MARRWGLCTSISDAPGCCRQEGHRATKPAPDLRAGKRELWTKEFSSWPQTKQLLLVTLFHAASPGLHLRILQEAATYNKSFLGSRM